MVNKNAGMLFFYIIVFEVATTRVSLSCEKNVRHTHTQFSILVYHTTLIKDHHLKIYAAQWVTVHAHAGLVLDGFRMFLGGLSP